MALLVPPASEVGDAATPRSPATGAADRDIQAFLEPGRRDVACCQS